MGYVITPYGYSVDIADGGAELPPIITADEFNAITGSRWATSQAAVNMALAAASQAVRDYCRWHVAPALACKVTLSPDGEGVLQLPCLRLVGITAATEDGNDIKAAIQAQDIGIIRKADGSPFTCSWSGLEIVYVAGFPTNSLLQGIVAQIAENRLAAPGGVREEHAGQVGITYNQTASGVAGGTALLERDMEMLSAYKLPSRW